jgi:hypothetical protein
MTPRHRESDAKIHRGRITKQGNHLVRWAAVEAVQRVHGGPIGATRGPGWPNAAGAPLGGQQPGQGRRPVPWARPAWHDRRSRQGPFRRWILW